MHTRRITVARGDGIGPEIMGAVLEILNAAKVPLDIEEVEIGEKLYRKGVAAGISNEAWESIRRTQVLLKAPVTTPQGGGVKSINVTLRTALGLYANVRPCVSYHPFVATKHPQMDVVIVRENEEDLYTGIEYRQTDEVYQCLKLISRPGSERIIRYAFDYAQRNNRKRVTCFSKDNIMKMTDGIFHRVFTEIAREYPEISSDHAIIDIGAARLATTPERFDVIVTENLYGDIISDIAAEVAGSVGLAGSANIGPHCAMFEAIHGSAPDIAGKGIANPSGLLLAAVQMLVHLGEIKVAATIHNSWLKTIEDGFHTGDIFKEGVSARRVSTQEFAEEVIARLGLFPERLKTVHYQELPPTVSERAPSFSSTAKTLKGVDIFFHHKERSPETLAATLLELSEGTELVLQFLSNRGQIVWPLERHESFYSDHVRARFLSPEVGAIERKSILTLLERATESALDFVKVENLYDFEGEQGWSEAQGR